MNASIIDPLQGDFPEVIEEYLEHGVMKCIAFNRRGTLLAAGCSDGNCVIWDFETRGIAKELRDKDCVAAITSVCWSKYGHRILVSAADKSLTLWDVVSGEKITRTILQQTPLQARLHPGSSTPSLCLACPLSSAPIIVDLNAGSTTVLPVSIPDVNPGLAPSSRNKISDGTPPFSPTAACFNKYGDLVYAGNSKGEILLIDYKSVQVCAMVPVSGGSVIKNIVFSRNGQYLLTNSNDRTIRIYENLLPSKDGLKALGDLNVTHDGIDDSVEKLKAVGSKCLTLFREFQDAITKMHWKAPCFSGDDYTENWSAFAPDFKELEENEEYVEREDEFDLIPETEKVKESDVNEDDEVDIVTVEKDSAFSDSDMSQEELCFLPAIPYPDVPEQQDKCIESSSKLVDSNNSGSPISEEGRPNGRANNHASSPLEEDAGATRLKRKRKPSEKGMEFQA
ncbi:protein RBL [Prunus yedoensis var. nudiflora]|uniref:Protein RBL n=1 Tax=Prunus yedoensis var. nudiflora TaxID=2094558 RepID=A0A314UTH4_PRUYE|nr:protein RBL [Prunus yedoensis var. nudiflora]